MTRDREELKRVGDVKARLDMIVAEGLIGLSSVVETCREASSLLSDLEAMQEALRRALWYVQDHNESQPNDQTTADLAAITAVLG